MCTICGVLMHIMLYCCKVILRFTLFCHKIRFVAIYALLRGKIERQIVPVEKKGQISCMHWSELMGHELTRKLSSKVIFPQNSDLVLVHCYAWPMPLNKLTYNELGSKYWTDKVNCKNNAFVVVRLLSHCMCRPGLAVDLVKCGPCQNWPAIFLQESCIWN